MSDEGILKKKFRFEDCEYELTLWIGQYADDPKCVGYVARYDDAELLNRCLVCGREYLDKRDGTFGGSIACEIIEIKDVIALRDGVRDFLEKKIDHFGLYPEKDRWSYFKLEMARDEDGEHCVAVVVQPYGRIEMASPEVTEDWLKSLLKYFDEIVELYPLRPFTAKPHKVEGAGKLLVILDGQ